MQSRTIESVLEEFRTENHPPMVRLVETLTDRLKETGLKYDVSMLRLWISRRDADYVQIMIAYGDGRGGGRPVVFDSDSYELTFFGANASTHASVQDLQTTVDLVEQWLR